MNYSKKKGSNKKMVIGVIMSLYIYRLAVGACYATRSL